MSELGWKEALRGFLLGAWFGLLVVFAVLSYLIFTESKDWSAVTTIGVGAAMVVISIAMINGPQIERAIATMAWSDGIPRV
jgi:hypothetical protein